jgi:hypothetical protein
MEGDFLSPRLVAVVEAARHAGLMLAADEDLVE